MSASAGKVMPRPMGEYNSATEYKILDIVTYNDRPYMALQTTTGNLPTNTTYWMLLLDFPTEVDNVPTQNSNNLVKSGGVYNAVEDKLNKDGSNSGVLNLYGNQGGNGVNWTTLAKDAGDNQDVTFIASMPDKPLAARVSFFSANVGNEFQTYVSGTGTIIVIIDSVADDGTDATVTGHLKVDNSAAISANSGYGTFNNFADGNEVIFLGDGNAAGGDQKLVVGVNNSIDTDYPGFVVGESNVVDKRYASAIGTDNFAHGNYSLVTGKENKSEYNYQTIVGYKNDNKADTVFEVGAGAFTGSAENVFEVYNDGHISTNNGTDKYKFAKSGGVDGFYDSSNTFHPFTGYKEFVNNSVVLSTSADTTVTFSNAAITADSTIEPFTSVWGINPSNVVASAGSCTVTIPKQSTAQTIMVKIRVS